MEQKTRSKPEKYLVLNVSELKTLIKMANNGREEASSNAVVIRLQHASRRHIGQLQYTEEFSKQRLEVIMNEYK